MARGHKDLLIERDKHWRAQGLEGADFYMALADDEALPQVLFTEDISYMSGFTEGAMEKRRQSGMAPPFLKLGRRQVRYPRREFFVWMASRYVARSDSKTGAEHYTQVA